MQNRIVLTPQLGLSCSLLTNEGIEVFWPIKKAAQPQVVLTGLRPRVSGAIFQGWSFAKNVMGQKRRAGE